MAGTENPNIKILISCHKEAPHPQSDVFLPVQVGAANAARRFEGMQPDDEGENISDRNFTFCELTAQYWAWKNLDADYYGLCHYRRYFCFDGLEHSANDHLQIEEDSLSSFSLRDYRLDDADLIERCVSECDMVAPNYWDISKAETPDGVKRTIQEHMVAYGLFLEDDIALLREIVQERQPEYANDLDAYLSGSKYLGYSCYIMRKDLFQRFCEFEFDVLLEFDKRFNYEGLTTTRKRICGYLGEILYSVFVRRIEEEELRIDRYPLVFFLDTSVSCAPSKEDSTGADLARIVWRYRDRPTSAFVVCLESLIRTLDPTRSYEVEVLHEVDFVFDTVLNALKAIPDNLIIKHSQWSVFDCPQEVATLSLDDFDIAQPLLLPWLSSGYENVLWIDGLALFQDDPAQMLNAVDGDSAFVCMQNILLQRELNKPTTRYFLSEYGLDTRVDEILDTTVMAINSKIAREAVDPALIVNELQKLRGEYRYTQPKRPEYKPEVRKRTEVPSAYLLGNQAFRAQLLSVIGAMPLPFENVSTCIDLPDTMTWANEDTARAWKAARHPTIVYPEYGKPPLLSGSHRFGGAFWIAARDTTVYEVLLAEELEPDAPSAKRLLFPEGSKRRRIASKMIRKFRK